MPDKKPLGEMPPPTDPNFQFTPTDEQFQNTHPEGEEDDLLRQAGAWEGSDDEDDDEDEDYDIPDLPPPSDQDPNA